MPKSFKEIGRKTEDLIEQGREADRQVSSCASRVASLNAAVANAQRELAQASSETDENGNPSGDVAGAQARLNMAKNQLAAGQRALSNAKQHANAVKSAKQSHASEIEKHNRVERGNMSKLKKLQTMAFGGDSAALIHGMAERLNEAEDARVKLLKSMGIDATPEYMNVSEGGGGSMGSERSLRQVGISGGALHYQGGSGGEGAGVSVALSSDYAGGSLGVSSLSSAGTGESGATGPAPWEVSPEKRESMPQGMPAGGSTWTENSMNDLPTFEQKMAGERRINDIVNALSDPSAASGEQRISMLVELRSVLTACSPGAMASNLYRTSEVGAIGNKMVLHPSKEYLKRMFDSYINGITEVYKENLITLGATAGPGLDIVINNLKEHYSYEANMDMLGVPSKVFSDPDFSSLVKKVNSFGYCQGIATFGSIDDNYKDILNQRHENADPVAKKVFDSFSKQLIIQESAYDTGQTQHR